MGKTRGSDKQLASKKTVEKSPRDVPRKSGNPSEEHARNRSDAESRNSRENSPERQDDENLLLGDLSTHNHYSLDEDELEQDQLSSLEQIARVPRFLTIQDPALQELSTPELTWLSERLPERYQYNRRPSVDFDRADRIRFLLQLKSWMATNRERRVRFTSGPNDSTDAIRVDEEPPPRHRTQGRRNREGDNNRRPTNRQRPNNNRRIYYPSPDPTQELLALSTAEVTRLARSDITWLSGLCTAIVTRHPELQVTFNEREQTSVIAAASTLQGRLDHLRRSLRSLVPISRGEPMSGNIQTSGVGEQSAILPRAQIQNHSGYPPIPAPRQPLGTASYFNNNIASRPPIQNPHMAGVQPQLYLPQQGLHAQPSGVLGFQEGNALPQNQSPPTWNGLPMASPEEVGHYAGLGTSPPQLLVRHRLGASILREFLLDGQNPEIYTRQRFADLRTKEREPSLQAYAEAVSLARTVHFIIHMFGNVATALRQCDALEIALRRLWVLLEVEQACFTGVSRKNAWRTYGIILEHTVHGQQSNSIVHQVMRRDFYAMERFDNAVGRMPSAPGGD